MQALTEIGIRPAAITEKPEAMEAPDSARQFTDALDRAAGGADDRPGPVDDTANAPAPEQENRDDPAAADAAAELAALNPFLAAPPPAVETPTETASELPPADMAAPDAAQTQEPPADMAAAGALSGIPDAAGAAQPAEPESGGAESFVRQVTERLEQKLTEASEPAPAGDAAVEKSAGGAARPAAQGNAAGGDGSPSEGGDNAFPTRAERAGPARTAGADAAQAAAAFSPTHLTARLEAAELTQAVERAIAGFSTDLRGLEVTPSEITIALDPEELGSISITISSQENHLTAKIVTDNKEAADLISSQMEHYLQNMQEKGVKVEKAEVIYSQLNQDGRSQGGQNRDPGGDQARFRIAAIERAEAEAEIAAPRPEARDIYETASSYYIPEAGYGLNLEFKA